MASTVLLGSLGVFVGDYEVVDDTFDCGLLLIQASLILLDAFLAAEEDKSVSHVEPIFFAITVFLDQLIDALVSTVLITAIVSV